ncbi:MAG: HepT-like ribonuclease domain-containing protein [Acidimicrobiia bacterium]
MMQPEPINNILSSAYLSCIKILHLIDKKSFDDFKFDEVAQDAIFWNMAVLGESFNRLPNEWIDEHDYIEIRKVIGMRNRILHGYDLIDIKIVYDVATTSVVQLKDQLEQLLQG